MKLDLLELKRMHPLLPASTAAEYAYRAAIGLERHHHSSGVALATSLDGTFGDATLHWMSPAPGDENQLDRIRITEDTAEAIALALVHEGLGWIVRRRLQRGEHADWLLQDGEARHVALEVSGIGGGRDPRRLREKIIQVARARVAECRAACVVELSHPLATLDSRSGSS